MKKNYLLLIVIGILNLSYAQKTTGVVSLIGVMTAKIDLNSTTSMVNLTLTGPSDRWFALGLNAESMETNTDCVVMRSATVLSDDKITGFSAPDIDNIQNWTISSNTVSGSTRTIVATRAFNTGDPNDYTFDYNLTTLNVIFSFGINASYNLAYHNSNRGITSLPFTDPLGIDDLTSLENVTVYPNPTNGVFYISKNNLTTITKIKIFNTNAKLIDEIKAVDSQNTIIDLASFSKGIYFIEISNENNKVVKKIQKN